LTKRQSEALDLGRHVTLRAGAGSGKTHVLTERCLSLLERGAAEVRGIVTITFTEKAALEMKGRVRAGVRKKIRAAAASGDRERIRFWESVLEELPEARISTIHSFCSSLLRESPLAAGVDPDFQMLDGPAAALLLEDAIADFLDAGKEDPAYEPLRTLAVLWNRAETAGVLKTLFGSRHGALAWARATAAAPAGVIAERQCKYIREWLEDYLGGGRLENTIAELEALVCRDESDRQFAQWSAALACLREARSRAGGGLERFDFSPLASLNFTGGSKRNWGDGDLETWKLLGKQLRETGETLNKFTWSRLDDGAVVPLKALAALFLDAAAEYKARKGNGALLDFDDLQEKALEYVRKNPGAAGGGKFTHIMIDEFQDTDSLQWELARAIARGGAEAFSANVFLVGDEKQSIYGFRGADVRVFGEAADMLSAAGGGRVSLDVNFRSQRNVRGGVRCAAGAGLAEDRVRADGAGPAGRSRRPAPREDYSRAGEGGGPGVPGPPRPRSGTRRPVPEGNDRGGNAGPRQGRGDDAADEDRRRGGAVQVADPRGFLRGGVPGARA